MENGEVFTPLSEITAAQKKDKSSAQVSGVPDVRTAGTGEDEAKRAGQVHFKAAHGLVVAFFTLIMYVYLPLYVRGSIGR
jgi:phosphatidylinositol glycan class O